MWVAPSIRFFLTAPRFCLDSGGIAHLKVRRTRSALDQTGLETRYKESCGKYQTRLHEKKPLPPSPDTEERRNNEQIPGITTAKTLL